MYMTARAEKYCLAGRRLESPGLYYQRYGTWTSLDIAFEQYSLFHLELGSKISVCNILAIGQRNPQNYGSHYLTKSETNFYVSFAE